jgi:hypothetical protein
MTRKNQLWLGRWLHLSDLSLSIQLRPTLGGGDALDLARVCEFLAISGIPALAIC